MKLENLTGSKFESFKENEITNAFYIVGGCEGTHIGSNTGPADHVDKTSGPRHDGTDNHGEFVDYPAGGCDVFYPGEEVTADYVIGMGPWEVYEN